MATEPVERSTHDLTRSELCPDAPASLLSSPHISHDTLASADEQPHLSLPTLQATNTDPKDQVTSSAEPSTATLSAPENTKPRLLPVPAATIHHDNPSQTSFVVPDSGGGESDRLPPEIANADVSIAADGSFVQTTSALAARELKKCYDKILGVGQGAQGLVRSPYAITAVQDEFGASVFRISHRVAHDTSTDDMTPSEPPSLHSPGHASGPRRKSRLSVHDFLPSSMFKPNNENGALPRHTQTMSFSSGSTPPANISSASSTPHVRRKLRKTRSNSELYLRGTGSPPHTGGASGDSSGHMSPPPRSESFSIEIRDELTAGADAFSQVLGWSSELTTDSITSTRKAAKSLVSPLDDDVQSESSTPLTAAVDTPLSRRPSVSTSAALSSTTGENSNAPFGENVRYTAPLRRSAILLESQPPQLREMQSFESGLTAKIGDDRAGTPGTPKTKSEAPGKEEPPFLTVKSQARFSTTVFDVLQTYRGLPLPSALLSAPPTGATIKLSSTDSANPKDDPRFVIWGEIQPEGTFVDDASVSHSQSSHVDLSASASSSLVSGPGTRKRSNARAPHTSNDAPQLVVNTETVAQTVMIAATVERWIAQLTSELNYDELLNFLLTYRTYISSVDLCHLLICRFHWALETPNSVQDDMVRRIVRVRTFIAIRYWLLTFFREDFLPNSELCHLFASWLNVLFRDPALKKHADALSIVRKLKKVVRECKTAHSRPGRAGVGRGPTGSTSPGYSSMDHAVGDLVRRSDIGRLNKNGSDDKAVLEIDDSDVDLDFSSTATPHYAEVPNGAESMTSSASLVNQSFTPPIFTIPHMQSGSSATPSANTILLSQPLSMTILGHVKSAKPGTDAPLRQTPASLPVQHSAISRAFVNTIGRLGRWKRVLNARSSVPAPHCGDMSAFDLEPNATGDLLAVRGGVEEYLKMLNLSPPPLAKAVPQDFSIPPESDVGHPARPPGLTQPADIDIGAGSEGDKLKSSGSSAILDVLSEETEDVGAEAFPLRRTRESYSSLVTQSDAPSEPEELGSEISQSTGWAPEIVSLDDYNLSDSDSSSRSPARVRRLPRRLPLRRDFQFVRRSVESVSSMGIRSQSSLASSIKSGSASGSVKSRQSTTSGGREVVTGHFHQWQIELISDDEEEAGDAEAALRRLEGQIDLDRQREKDIKVGRWLKSASKRPNHDGASSIRSGSQFSEEEEDEDERAGHDPPDNEDITVSVNSTTLRSISVSPVKDASKSPVASPLEPTYVSTTGLTPVSGPVPTVPSPNRDRSGSVESNHAAGQSRPDSRLSYSGDGARRPSLLGRASRNPAPSKFGSPNMPSAHRSFILMHRSETLAQQFAIIEAELFVKIKFEELISHQWGQSLEDVNVRDWVQFVKERAKLKNTGKPALGPMTSPKLSAILALRARFDLLVNFTSSEILLTHPGERVMVVEKFIRVAWKAYLHNNFSTLVSLMAGLQTRWVNQAMGRQWHKVGMWEQRVFDDLKKFTSRPGEFKFLRNATAALVDARPLHVVVKDGAGPSGMVGNAGSATTKSKSAEAREAPSACVPFLGVYLAQLYEYERLPDFVDPTAPAEPVLIDGDTGMLSPPSHPEVFFNLQSLPRDLILEPLINVHKQRLIAGVIKSFVAGQHLATNIPFEVDQRCYQKCFRLRSLDSDALHSIAKSIVDP